MRMRTFVSGLAAAVFLAGTASASVASPRQNVPTGTQQSVEQAQKSEKGDQVPAIVRRWAAAWGTTDTRDLARMYTKDAVYTDRALNLVFRGREGVTEWETGSHQLTDNIRVEVTGGFRGHDGAVVQGVFSGHIAGAPRPFAVPLVTVLRLRGNLIRSSDDYYNRAEILTESGLPADWTPTGN
jgi:hypothetical protein